MITLTFTVSPERPTSSSRRWNECGARASGPEPSGGAVSGRADSRRFIETFLVPSWQEHLRQHTERLTGADQELEQEALALADGPPEVAHPFRVPRNQARPLG